MLSFLVCFSCQKKKNFNFQSSFLSFHCSGERRGRGANKLRRLSICVLWDETHSDEKKMASSTIFEVLVCVCIWFHSLLRNFSFNLFFRSSSFSHLLSFVAPFSVYCFVSFSSSLNHTFYFRLDFITFWSFHCKTLVKVFFFYTERYYVSFSTYFSLFPKELEKERNLISAFGETH